MCRPLEPNILVLTGDLPHCYGKCDVKPLPGTLGGFTCDCECNRRWTGVDEDSVGVGY